MSTPLLVLPVENQVRELDAKLLLACAAAQRGVTTIIGWRGLIDARIARFGQSIYVAKSMSRQNAKILSINRMLGNIVLAWDEEALVHYPQDIYHARRIGSDALRLIDVFICWGQDNRRLLEAHPGFPGGDVRVIGNPRADLLREEFAPYFEEDVKKIKNEYGEFILINTNFGSINAYADSLNLVRGAQNPDEGRLGRGAIGMPESYARGLAAYRQSILRAFESAVAEISRHHPDKHIILRPHPSENHDAWIAHCRLLSNVHIIAEGNVIPWLMAARCLIHNGCTTAVEASLLGREVISFMPIEDPNFDFELPNKLGRRAHDAAAVNRLIDTIFASTKRNDNRCFVRNDVLRQYITSTPEQLASEAIAEVVIDYLAKLSQPKYHARWLGLARAEARALSKRMQALIGVARYEKGFVEQRFPEISESKIQAKADVLTQLLHASKRVRVKRCESKLFEISAVK